MKATQQAQTSAQNELKAVNEAVNVLVNELQTIEEIAQEIAHFVELPMNEVMQMSPEAQAVYFDKLQLSINAKREADKASGQGNYARYLNKFDYILLHIFNSGASGFTVEQMVKVGQNYVDKKGSKSGYSLGQIATQWNTAYVLKQRGFLLLTNPTELEPDSQREPIECNIIALTEQAHPSGFLAKANKRTNNRIFITSGQENVRNYLLSRGAKEDLTDYNNLLPNLTEVKK